MQNSDLENQKVLVTKTENSSGILSNGSKEEKSNDCLECLGFCTIILFCLGLIAGSVSYIVFGIIYLVKDYHIASDCKQSNLWAYVLVAIILGFSRTSVKDASNSHSKSPEVSICTLICLGIIESGLAIWGGMELWGQSCDDLRESHLWEFGLVTFCLQTFCAGLFLVIFPLIICFVMCKSNS